MYGYPKSEQPTSPPILTDRERHDIESAIKYRESRIEAEVENRMFDDDAYWDAFLICAEDNISTRARLINWLRRGADASITRANVNLDVMDMIRFQVEKDEQRGRL